MHLLFLLLQCQACPSLIVAQSGGGDGFLFGPSMIPFLNVVQCWSPFASALGSVAVSCNVILFRQNTYLQNKKAYAHLPRWDWLLQI